VIRFRPERSAINFTYLHRAEHGTADHQHHGRGIRAAIAMLFLFILVFRIAANRLYRKFNG
jgi:hypothetical protein